MRWNKKQTKTNKLNKPKEIRRPKKTKNQTYKEVKSLKKIVTNPFCLEKILKRQTPTPNLQTLQATPPQCLPAPTNRGSGPGAWGAFFWGWVQKKWSFQFFEKFL